MGDAFISGSGLLFSSSCRNSQRLHRPQIKSSISHRRAKEEFFIHFRVNKNPWTNKQNDAFTHDDIDPSKTV